MQSYCRLLTCYLSLSVTKFVPLDQCLCMHVLLLLQIHMYGLGSNPIEYTTSFNLASVLTLVTVMKTIRTQFLTQLTISFIQHVMLCGMLPGANMYKYNLYKCVRILATRLSEIDTHKRGSAAINKYVCLIKPPISHTKNQ